MRTENLRQQGADACRAYFAERGDDFCALCAAGRGDMVTKELVVSAIAAAAEAVGIYDAPGLTTFAEGYVAQATIEIEDRRAILPSAAH